MDIAIHSVFTLSEVSGEVGRCSLQQPTAMTDGKVKGFPHFLFFLTLCTLYTFFACQYLSTSQVKIMA